MRSAALCSSAQRMPCLQHSHGRGRSALACPTRRPLRAVLSGRNLRRSKSSIKAVSADSPSVAELAEKFDIGDSVVVTQNQQGLKKVVLQHACGASAEVFLFGACVTSWKQASGDEVLYIRPDAKFDGSKPISGGIPHCFPQFGPGKIQQHGFARNLTWKISSTSADPQPDDLDPEVTLVLEDSEETRSMWPHPFKAVYSVSLHGENLRTDLRIINTGGEAFEFTAALHTYIEVLDIAQAKVEGLQGLDFLDKVKDINNPAKGKEEREFVTFEGPVDSVYANAPERVALEVGTGAAVQIVSKGWEDVVVWNPHEAMPDCYRQFACVENAKFTRPQNLKPGEDWRAEQEFTVITL